MILVMDKSKINCNQCDGEIIEYFDEGYKGKRGKCPNCDTNFPLE